MLSFVGYEVQTFEGLDFMFLWDRSVFIDMFVSLHGN